MCVGGRGGGGEINVNKSKIHALNIGVFSTVLVKFRVNIPNLGTSIL